MARFVEEHARAKVNLTLEVKGRLAEGHHKGYHALESLVVFPDIADRIRVEEASELSLQVTGPGAAALSGLPSEDNLVMRTAQALQVATGVSTGAAITLEKHLPSEAGIGGGSADAAATLRALMRLWDASLTAEDLVRLAMSLGADVPVALTGEPSLMSGIGEVVRPLKKMPGFGLVLVNCGLRLATPDVFKALAASDIAGPPTLSELPSFSTFEELVAYLLNHPNSLETPASRIAPAITESLEALEALPEVSLAGMSGSGATCFGLFKTVEAAKESAHALATARRNWWVRAGAVAGLGDQ